MFLIQDLNEGKNSSRSSEAEILGGTFGFFLNKKIESTQMTEQNIASTNISIVIWDLLLFEVTNIAGNTNPIAAPIGFDIVPTVVAIVRISGLNQVAATFAGELRRKGCPIAPKVLPMRMNQKLSIAPSRTQAPMVVKIMPARI